MNGIDKITEKIISDAREKAQKALDAAYAERDELISSANARARAVTSAYDERLEKQRSDAEMRAESANEQEKRNASLVARANLIERAFTEAHRRLSDMRGEEYFDFLTKLLAGTVKEREAADAAIDAGTDEYDEFDRYELMLNSRDRAEFGERLVAFAGGKIGSKELALSDENADIDGGFILHWGRVYLNCSLAGLIRTARDTMEREVCDILYGRDRVDEK